MKTLLRIDSSPMVTKSISRHLTGEFVRSWSEANPSGRVIERDLSATLIAPIDEAWIGAVYTPEESKSSEQKQLLSLSDTLISELFAADEYVIGVPMHNFAVPSALKLWIDQVIRGGKTFSYATGTPEGLLTNRRAHVLVASGGTYDAGTAMASFNFVEPYLRTVLGFIGVSDVTFVSASGAASLMQGKVDRQSFLRPLEESVKGLFRAA
jgi:FMN-dependent NADH-azoreductase